MPRKKTWGINAKRVRASADEVVKKSLTRDSVEEEEVASRRGRKKQGLYQSQ